MKKKTVKKTARRRQARQQDLPFKRWGGKRKGAGRKPGGERAGASHKARALLASRYPVHVNVKVKEGLPSLRQGAERETLIEAFRAGAERFGFRLVHYSIQTNHVHFLVEAKDRRALSRGMQGLKIRMARRLNRLWGRQGRVFADRYHDVILKTPRQVRNALVYVLHNVLRHARRHGKRIGKALDVCASGRWFDGWRDERNTHVPEGTPRPTVHARTWLLGTGWRTRGGGRIGLDEMPAGVAGY